MRQGLPLDTERNPVWADDIAPMKGHLFSPNDIFFVSLLWFGFKPCLGHLLHVK